MAKGIKNVPDPNPPMKLEGKDYVLFVNNEVQEINGVQCELKSITKNQHVNSIWKNGTEYFHWVYKFEYFNFSKKGFSIEINHDNQIVKFTEINH